jgi:hypothetical protein
VCELFVSYEISYFLEYFTTLFALWLFTDVNAVMFTEFSLGSNYQACQVTDIIAQFFRITVTDTLFWGFQRINHIGFVLK